MNNINEAEISNFIFEMRQLREVKRSGWQLLGIPNKESVAEHSLRAAQIGFFLAHMEGGVDPLRVATMLVFHDIGEARIGDVHQVANPYISPKIIKKNLFPPLKTPQARAPPIS